MPACLTSRILILLLAGLIALPMLVVSSSWLMPISDLWQHFQETLLTELLSNTAILLFGVAIGVGVLGTVLAWLVVMVEFPLRKYLEWALFLPFAIPAYVLGFVYLGLFDYAGVFQTFLRESLGLSGFDLRAGYLPVILTFVLVFYPYVYIMCRASFKRQQANIYAQARLLGVSPWQVFWRISVPLARPAIVAGVLVTMMETLADFGMVSLFNYDTLTTAIYSAWGDFRSVSVAAQLASLLVLIAGFFIVIDKLGQKNSKYYNSEVTKHRPYKLSGFRAYLTTGFILSILFLSFILPVSQLIIWSYNAFDWHSLITRNLELATNTISLSLIATIIIITIASILALPNRCLKNHPASTIATKISTLGYAIPGSVMAVGLLYGVASLSNLTQAWFDVSLSQYLFGGIVLLLFAYTSRFMAVAFNAIDSATAQIKPSLTQSAQLLGANHISTAFKIQLPLMLPGIVAACLLVLVDVSKELPATYLLRPFGWDTLAVEVYELSSEGLYEQAAAPALIMVLIAMMLIVFFQRFDRRLN